MIDLIKQPLLLSAAQAAAMLSISRGHFYVLHHSGRLGPLPIRLNKSVRWRVAELEEWTKKGCPPRVKWLEIRDGKSR